MEITSLDELVRTFRAFPFTVKVEGSFVDAGIVIISLEFFNLTMVPIKEFSDGDTDVLSVSYWIDINELLAANEESYKTVSGKWVHGIMPSPMCSMLAHSLAEGEMIDPRSYAYVEYILEYYFNYVTLYPSLESIEIEGDTYYNQKGLDVSDAARMTMLSCFHLSKTRELYRMFGTEAVHWMNFIREQLGLVQPQPNKEMDETEKMLQAIKAKAKLLRASISGVANIGEVGGSSKQNKK